MTGLKKTLKYQNISKTSNGLRSYKWTNVLGKYLDSWALAITSLFVTFNGSSHTKVNKVIEGMGLKWCGNVGVWKKKWWIK